MKLGRLHRILAIFFLIFACVDYLSLEVCSEEMGGVAIPCTHIPSASTHSNDVDGRAFVNDSGQGQHSDPVSCQEECFCCCSHILPVLHFEVPQLAIEPPARELTIAILPIPPPQTLFHPPRLS
jgi:hypothetical protein